MTLTFDLETGAHYCLWGGQPASGTFCSRSIGQHLSDASRDLAILTFDLGDHGACQSDVGHRTPSVYQVSSS